MAKLSLVAVEGMPLIVSGDNVAALIIAAGAQPPPGPGDVIVVAQKIVSKAEGQLVKLSDVTPSPAALALASEAEKDPRLVELILSQSRQVIRVRPGVIIVEHKQGTILANAGIDRTRADQMGMLATVMNSLAMQDACIKQGAECHVLSALSLDQVCEPYSASRARNHLLKGRIVIMAAGSGNPYFTTDTAASLRALEIHADLLLKGTKVDGVYDKDPAQFADAKRYESLSYHEAIAKELGVMDLTALVLCRDNDLSMQVYNLFEESKLSSIVKGDALGTILEV